MREILFYSAAAGFATLLGGLAAYFLPKKRSWPDFFSSLAGGLMLALSLVSLLPGACKSVGPPMAFLGAGLGFALLWFGEALLKLAQPLSASPLLRSAIIIACGIAFHDFPEGAAISIGFELQKSLGFGILLAIGLHNIPEGLAVAIPLLAAGEGMGKILLILTGISLCTPLGAALGLFSAGFLLDYIGVLLGIAAGAMIFVAILQLLPEAWKRRRKFAIIGIMGGIIIAGLISLLEFLA